MRRRRILHCCVALALLSWGWIAFAQSPNVPSAQDISALKKQAASGNADSQYRLGLLYNNGKGIPQDSGQTAYWWYKSAAQGNVNAESSLGWFYFNFNNHISSEQAAERDEAQAAIWFRKAAEQGDAESEYALGICYERGKGVPEDHAQAVYWYRRAAKHGIAEAQGNLGAMQDEDWADVYSFVAVGLVFLLICYGIAYLIYDAFRRSGAKSFREWISPFCWAIGIFAVVIGFLVLFPYWLYLSFANDPWVPSEIDSTGFVSHTVQSTITAQANWMIGESKDCISYPLDADTARTLDKQAGYAFSGVQCDKGPVHSIAIRFWGAENQPENKVAYWNCKRTTDSFICEQTGAN